MGIRGLTSYIDRKKDYFLKDHKLSNSHLVVDGNSLAAQLYTKHTQPNDLFSGDYDCFRSVLVNFFKILEKCNIKPIVVFDGGYENSKLGTAFYRMRQKIKYFKNPGFQSITAGKAFPLFYREVLKDVLVEYKIPHARADLEADIEIACLARHLNCPVLSFDSDFYIYGVEYIPIPYVDINPNTNHLSCKLYKIEHFLDYYGGLDKSQLPLMAILLGNDHVRRKVFAKFYNNMKIQKSKKRISRHQKRISAVINWLKNESFDSAVEKILSRAKKGTQRQKLNHIIKRETRSYICDTTYLQLYVGLQTGEEASAAPSAPQERLYPDLTEEKREMFGDDQMEVGDLIDFSDDKDESIQNNLDSVCSKSGSFEKNIDKESSEDNESSGEESESEKGKSKCDDEDENDDDEELEKVPEVQQILKDFTAGNSNTLPSWFLDKFRNCSYPAMLMDAWTKNTVFCTPQLEDHASIHSHYLGLKFLAAVFEILHSNPNVNKNVIVRTNSTLSKIPIEHSGFKDLPKLSELPGLTKASGRNLLLSICDIPGEIFSNISQLPPYWQLYFIAIVYWAKHATQPKATMNQLISLMICVVVVALIEERTGRFRTLKKYTQVHGKKVAKYLEAKKSAPSKSKTDETRDLMEKIKFIEEEDYWVAENALVKYFEIDEKLLKNPKSYSIETVDALVKFQGCLFHLCALNNLLDNPFQHTDISLFYNGTFIYNMAVNLEKRVNVPAYLQTLLGAAPSVLDLVLSLKDIIKVPVHDQPTRFRKRKRKSRSRKRKHSESDSSDGGSKKKEVDSDEDSNSYDDENNQFSMLTVEES